MTNQSTLQQLLADIQEGNRPLPWVVHSGSSYRRIASIPTRENGYRSFPDGNVLCGIIQRSDGHPDLSMGEDQLTSLVSLINAIPDLLSRIEKLEGAERFYIDCEFDGHDGPLLSLAMVREDGESIHIQAKIFALDLWVQDNVMPLMDLHKATQSAKVYVNEIGGVIRAFIGDCEHPTIIADSPVDIGRFCTALSTGGDGRWASANYPRMSFEVHNVDCYPTTLPGAVQHNAWWDAMALRHALSQSSPEGGE